MTQMRKIKMENATRRAVSAPKAVVLIIAVCAFSASHAGLARAAAWAPGDVFAAVSNGQYQVRDGAGVLKETLADGLGGFTTVCAFDSANDLYTTNFSSTKVIKYDDIHPHGILQVINTTAASPCSHRGRLTWEISTNQYDS